LGDGKETSLQKYCHNNPQQVTFKEQRNHKARAGKTKTQYVNICNSIIEYAASWG